MPAIQAMLETRTPLFGICLGHQMLGLAIGAKTMKMPQGHHGANHPVKDFTTDKVEIVSMNHGFAMDPATLPANARVTHVSLFDQSNCGIALTDRPAFSVQYHPEASPGPHDSHYLFRRFVETHGREKGGEGPKPRHARGAATKQPTPARSTDLIPDLYDRNSSRIVGRSRHVWGIGTAFAVLAGLVAAIHAVPRRQVCRTPTKCCMNAAESTTVRSLHDRVDGRDKPGHDGILDRFSNRR